MRGSGNHISNLDLSSQHQVYICLVTVLLWTWLFRGMLRNELTFLVHISVNGIAALLGLSPLEILASLPSPHV